MEECTMKVTCVCNKCEVIRDMKRGIRLPDVVVGMKWRSVASNRVMTITAVKNGTVDFYWNTGGHGWEWISKLQLAYELVDPGPQPRPVNPATGDSTVVMRDDKPPRYDKKLVEDTIARVDEIAERVLGKTEPATAPAVDPRMLDVD